MTVYRAAARIISQRFVAANLLVSSRQATITARITCVGINEKMRLFGSDSITVRKSMRCMAIIHYILKLLFHGHPCGLIQSFASPPW